MQTYIYGKGLSAHCSACAVLCLVHLHEYDTLTEVLLGVLDEQRGQLRIVVQLSELTPVRVPTEYDQGLIDGAATLVGLKPQQPTRETNLKAVAVVTWPL